MEFWVFLLKNKNIKLSNTTITTTTTIYKYNLK